MKTQFLLTISIFSIVAISSCKKKDDAAPATTTPTTPASPWAVKTSGTTKSLYAVCFINETNGFAGGYDGTLLKTTDGGSTWAAITTTASNTINDIVFPTPSLGFLVEGGLVGGFYKTTDGGANWADAMPNSSVNGLSAICFPTATKGYFCGSNLEFDATTDGGATSTRDILGNIGNARDIFFVNDSVGYAVGYDSYNTTDDKGRIDKTTNGGKTWTDQTSGVASTGLNSVYFSDLNNGIIVGEGGKILKTTNGGTTWTAQTSGVTKTLYAVAFSSATAGIAVGDAGTVLSTTDGGTTWTTVNSSTSESLYKIQFVTATTAFAVGSNGVIIKTTSGGK